MNIPDTILNFASPLSAVRAEVRSLDPRQLIEREGKLKQYRAKCGTTELNAVNQWIIIYREEMADRFATTFIAWMDAENENATLKHEAQRRRHSPALRRLKKRSE